MEFPLCKTEEPTHILLSSQPATEEQKAWHAYLRSSLLEDPKSQVSEKHSHLKTP